MWKIYAKMNIDNNLLTYNKDRFRLDYPLIQEKTTHCTQALDQQYEQV